jgi:putative transposase
MKDYHLHPTAPSVSTAAAPWLFPLVQLVEQSRQAVQATFDQLNQRLLELLLEGSAEAVAGPKTPGKAKGAVRWHGRQPGVVTLPDRRLRLSKPRLRHVADGEVEVPAYAALQNQADLGAHLLNVLLRGVSTRQYRDVLPAMVETVGVSRSALSRRLIEASEQALAELVGRRFDHLDLLVIYLDGIVLGGHHLLAAVGVDRLGNKHVLGLKEGASENGVVAQGLLEDLIERGVDPNKAYLFVIDGSKALRRAVTAVFGAHQPVQRCRRHKERNVLGYLPEAMHEAARQQLRAAWALPAKEGMAALEALARSWEKSYPGAAASVREGLAECFTINRLGVPAALCRSLASTNAIESTFSGARSRVRRVTRWRGGAMTLRWAAAALLKTEKHYRKVMGYRCLSHLENALRQKDTPTKVTPRPVRKAS